MSGTHKLKIAAADGKQYNSDALSAEDIITLAKHYPNNRDYRLAPAYDLLNTSVHVNGDDLGLDGGLSPDIEKSDVFDKTGYPCLSFNALPR